MNRFAVRKMTPLQRAGLWLVGFVLVVIFAIWTLGVDLSLSQFSAGSR